MLEVIELHVLFNELHRSIEESATVTVDQSMAGTPERYVARWTSRRDVRLVRGLADKTLGIRWAGRL